jgi:hypothetical protein
LGATCVWVSLGNHDSIRERQGLFTTLGNQCSISANSRGEARRRHGLSPILSNDRSQSGQRNKV